MTRPLNPKLVARAQMAVRQIYQCKTPEQLRHVEQKCAPLLQELEPNNILDKGIRIALIRRKKQIDD